MVFVPFGLFNDESIKSKPPQPDAANKIRKSASGLAGVESKQKQIKINRNK